MTPGGALALLVAAAVTVTSDSGYAGPEPEAAAALVGVAHAAAREGRLPDARRGYLEAARLVPDIRSWLLLRAAAATSDSAERALLYPEIRVAAARDRIAATEAAARELAGDRHGAALRYDSLGRVADAYRVRIQAAAQPERIRLRADLVARIERETDAGQTRALSDAFLQAFPMPSAAEALVLARAAGRSRDTRRAAAQYPPALAAGLGTSADRLAYAHALADLRRHREALAAYGKVGGTPATRAAAAYGAARSRLRLGERTAATSALWQLVERYPSEGETVAKALLLAGELARDAGNLDEARRVWLDLARRHPASTPAPRARYLAALAAYERGRYSAAAREWSALRADHPEAEPAPAAGYWAGRAWDRVGGGERAAGAWRDVLSRDTLSYYAVLSARRLGVPAWRPAPAEDHAIPRLADVDSALGRIALLRAVGMTAEAGWERDWQVAAAAGAPDRLVVLADAFHRDGQGDLAIRLARQALAAGAATDTRLYRLLYPLGYEPEVRRLSRDAGLEPELVAALIRQESAWQPQATSVAGARGLMQVMPATGAQLARRLGTEGWHPDRLYEPAANLHFGVTFLAEVMRRFEGDTMRALAAYNAGPSAVARWSAGGDDPELFVERIPYTETRDYVRIVLRNQSLYRALYDTPV